MELKKYWWILYIYTEEGQTKVQHTCTDRHPFQWASDHEKAIVNWRGVSAEEYNLWEQLNEEETNE